MPLSCATQICYVLPLMFLTVLPFLYCLTCVCTSTLKAEGTLDAKLHEMYHWGKQYGWEPVQHVNGVPQPPAMTAAAAAAAAAAAGVAAAAAVTAAGPGGYGQWAD
jgi:hypothetical protein